MVRRALVFSSPVLVCMALCGPALAQTPAFNPAVYYRLTTQWQGDGKSLDVVNDGAHNNRLHLAPTGALTGQMWKIVPLGNGYFRLTTQWQGEGKSLDVINDGVNNKLQLAPTASVSGQYWKIVPLGGGHFRLTTQWQGDGKSLDVVNDGVNNKLQLAPTASVSGQYWKIVDYAAEQRPPPPAPAVRAVGTGPIWNQADAQQKCPRVCAPPSKWTGGWRTTVPNKASSCDCAG